MAARKSGDEVDYHTCLFLLAVFARYRVNLKSSRKLQQSDCFEDLAGAGAIIQCVSGQLSPEAAVALVFDTVRLELRQYLEQCGSGIEKIGRGEGADVSLASELNVSDWVPIMVEGAYRERSQTTFSKRPGQRRIW